MPVQESVGWEQFLATHPPDKLRVVDGLGRRAENHQFILSTEDLELNCNSEKCGGVRLFRCMQENLRGLLNQWQRFFIIYECRNCLKATKEWRRAEGQGMGIGAFAYYRRVVENRRTDLFDKLIEAAQRLNADSTAIAGLNSDRDNWQFSHSIEGLKSALPDSLKVQGHNPLALLHNALSHNLHNETDEACLQAAEDIRVVLTFFAEQLVNVLMERTELEKAVGRLTRSAAK